MRHYRENKLAKAGGIVAKRKDILAEDDREAVARAENDSDCPVYDVGATVRRSAQSPEVRPSGRG